MTSLNHDVELRTIDFFRVGLHYYNSFLAPIYAIRDSKKKQAKFFSC
jgi:hypothetical protein